MAKRPYNPQFHRNIADNVRRDSKAAGLDTTHLTDEQVYDLYMEAYFCDDTEAVLLDLVRESLPKTVAVKSLILSGNTLVIPIDPNTGECV